MNIKEILESKDAVEALTAQVLPMNTAIKLSKLQKELNEILEIYQDRRKKLFEMYGEGDNFEIPATAKATFIKEHNDLILEELDIVVDIIDVADLDTIQISPNHLTNLGWLIV